MQKLKKELDETKLLFKQCLDQIENGPRKCSKHKDGKTIFCRLCAETICATCIITEHIKHDLITLKDEAEHKKFFMERLKQQTIAVTRHMEIYQKTLHGFKKDIITNSCEQMSLVDARMKEIIKSIEDHGNMLKEQIRSNMLAQEQKLDAEMNMVETYRGKIMSLHAMYDSKVPTGVHLEDVANIDLDEMQGMMETLFFRNGHTGLSEYMTSSFKSDSFEVTGEMLGKIETSTKQIPSPILPRVIGEISAPQLSERTDNSNRDPSCKDQMSICDGFVAVTGYKSTDNDDSTKPYYAMIFNKEAFLWEHQIAEGTGHGSIDTGICLGKIDEEIYLFVSYRKMKQIEVWNVSTKSLVSAFVFQDTGEDTDLRLMVCTNNKLYLTEAYFNVYRNEGRMCEPDDPMITFQTMSFSSGLRLDLKKRIKTKFSQRKNIQGFCVANVQKGQDVFVVTTDCPGQVTAFDEDGNEIWAISDIDLPGDICWDGKYFFVVTERNHITLVNDMGLKLVILPMLMTMTGPLMNFADCLVHIRSVAVQDNILGILIHAYLSNLKCIHSEVHLRTLCYTNESPRNEALPQ